MKLPSPTEIRRVASAGLRSAGRLARIVTPRIYALVLILLIGWLTWRSVRYLVASLTRPARPPAQIVDLPTRLDEAMLRTQSSAWAGLRATEHPRTPPAHYHRIDAWIHPDPRSDCTQSGCHGPLPHHRRKEVRAFLNMHATSMHCGVCHFDRDDRPLKLVWYDLDDGRPRPPPSILAALDLLTADHSSADDSSASADATPTDIDQARIVRLLEAAAEEADDAQALKTLAEHFAAVRPGSSAYRKLTESTRQSLPRHFRGEYGAKLAVRKEGSTEPLLAHPGSEAAVQKYLTSTGGSGRPSSVGRESGVGRASLPATADNKTLLDAIHPLRRSQPRECHECHTAEGGLIDFAAAGFPRVRVNELVDPIVVRMIEHVSQGRAFQMPSLRTPTPPKGEE